MSVAEAVRQKQNQMGMIRRAIRLLELSGEDVEAEKTQFFDLFGVSCDHRSKVFARKVHNPRVRNIAQFRRYESEGVFPAGLEKHLRSMESMLKVETEKRVSEHPDWSLSSEEEAIICHVAETCIKFNIDTDFYRAEFSDPLYESEDV